MRKYNLVTALVLGVAVLHLLVLTLIPKPIFASNVIQLVACAMATVLCILKARRATGSYFRKLWSELFLAFGLWTVGQLLYVQHLYQFRAIPSYPSITDLCFLLYSYPMLLVASTSQNQPKQSLIGILDLVQAAVAICAVHAILLTSPSGNIDFLVYAIQGSALLFAAAIRYSTAGTKAERVFFRNLALYVIAFDVMGLIGRIAVNLGFDDGTVTDLAWSYPFLFFCFVVTVLPERLLTTFDQETGHTILPAHIHGLSSLGLTLTSAVSAVLLTSRSPKVGIPFLVISGLAFTVRTAYRELHLTRVQVQLEHDILHDPLTGLGNRAMLIRTLESPSRTPGKTRSLLFIDLDHFKTINDGFGHHAGDRVLIHVANILRATTRKRDTVTRLSGDEFVVLHNGEQRGLTAGILAERILETLRNPIVIDGKSIKLSASIGIVSILPTDAVTQLLRNADTAMYIAKSLGKNCIHKLDPSILQRTIGEIKIEADLRRSMEESEIVVAYQPIYALPSRNLIGFEALARWTHPQRGMISPSEFIPMAESTGLILTLGEQILRMACEQTCRWNREFGTRLTVSANVSVRQLMDTSFLPTLQAILDETGFDPSCLKLEITESVFLHDREGAKNILSAAQKMGIEICLDDFGTGYSSLSYLVDFPFDTIKIDRSFFLDLEENPRRAVMLHSIAQLANSLQKKVIAEGIETEDQLKFLDSIPCDYVQGFLFSSPLMKNEMTQLLETLPIEVLNSVLVPKALL